MKRRCDDGGRAWGDASAGRAMPRTSWSRQKLGETSQDLQKGPPLLTPRLQTSGLQNGEKTHFCCFHPQVCGPLSQQPWELTH